MSEPDDHAVTEDVVATLRLPVPVRALEALSDALHAAYGPGLRMMSSDDGAYLVITSPTAAGPEAGEA